MNPLGTLLLRYGVTHSDFVEISKRLYVRVAENNPEFQLNERKQSISRISIRTGINRKKVACVQVLASDTEFKIKTHTQAIQVINGWLRDSEYHDDVNSPAKLSLNTGKQGFESLVKKYSGDMPVSAALDELLRVGAVKKVDKNKLKISSNAYIPQNCDSEKLEILGSSVTDLLNTLSYNIPRPIEESRLQQTLAYDNLPQDAVKEFKKLSEKHAQQTLLLLNDWLAKNDRDSPQTASGTDLYRAGLDIYYFEECTKEKNDEV